MSCWSENGTWRVCVGRVFDGTELLPTAFYDFANARRRALLCLAFIGYISWTQQEIPQGTMIGGFGHSVR
jgi:hypothetical protein